MKAQNTKQKDAQANNPYGLIPTDNLWAISHALAEYSFYLNKIKCETLSHHAWAIRDIIHKEIDRRGRNRK